jgi:hypothetical protein
MSDHFCEENAEIYKQIILNHSAFSDFADLELENVTQNKMYMYFNGYTFNNRTCPFRLKYTGEIYLGAHDIRGKIQWRRVGVQINTAIN